MVNSQTSLDKSLFNEVHSQTIQLESEVDKSLFKSQIHDSLLKKLVSHETQLIRQIPTMVLYNSTGLSIFDRITYLPEYYPTNCEIDIFVQFGEEMAQKIDKNSIIIELGVGSMRKTRHFLQNIVALGHKNHTYYAIDLDYDTLKLCLDEMSREFPTIQFIGLVGEYSKGLAYCAALGDCQKVVLWLGSSIGGMSRIEASNFVQGISEDLFKTGDLLFCGIDQRNSKCEIELAYDDPQGVTKEFILNGLDSVNETFGSLVFDKSNFDYVSIYNQKLGRHEAFVKSLVVQTLNFPGNLSSIQLDKEELINIEYSYKYNSVDCKKLAEESKLCIVSTWQDATDRYSMYLFQKPPFFFSRSPIDKFDRCPSMDEFRELFKAWEFVTSTMIGDYNARPISLRLPYIFYVGHIPAFSDLMLSKCLKEELTKPTEFAGMFERGIDPDITTNEIHHSHSEIRCSWPEFETVKAYSTSCFQRIFDIYQNYDMNEETNLERVLWMIFEHTAMHLETLLYILLQDPNRIPPTGICPPPKTQLKSKLSEAAFVSIKGGLEVLGIADLETFGWDNECGPRFFSVADFKIQTRPISIGEYFKFLEKNRFSDNLMPSTWISNSNASNPTCYSEFSIKTIFGLYPLISKWNHPVQVSFDQADSYSKSLNLRLPTEPEIARYRRVVSENNKEFGNFGKNVGFHSWGTEELSNFSPENGGLKYLEFDGNLWEWTNSEFGNFDGFVASELYEGYSRDFFDGKHVVLVGSSWATHPRIAFRQSVRNFYQKGYPFVFGTFRCVEEQ